MSSKAAIVFSATGFGPTKEPVEISLSIEVAGLGTGSLSVEAAKELLARVAIILVDEKVHVELARDLTTPLPVPLPASRPRRRAALERVK